MTIKGESIVIQDVYDSLEKFFEGKISGLLYPKDCRPFDSKLEDAVISGANPTAEQIQYGTVKLNVFIPDIDNGSGRFVPDIERLQYVELLNNQIIEVLNDSNKEYEFWQGMAPSSLIEPEINQHFINFDIKFKRITF